MRPSRLRGLIGAAGGAAAAFVVLAVASGVSTTLQRELRPPVPKPVTPILGPTSLAGKLQPPGSEPGAPPASLADRDSALLWSTLLGVGANPSGARGGMTAAAAEMDPPSGSGGAVTLKPAPLARSEPRAPRDEKGAAPDSPAPPAPARSGPRPLAKASAGPEPQPPASVSLEPRSIPSQNRLDESTALQQVVNQLEAFKRSDYDDAYAYASESLQRRFPRQEFESMVKTSYPEIASYSQAELGRTEVRSGSSMHLHLTIRGSNGHRVAALYQMVWGAWRLEGARGRHRRGASVTS